MLNEIVDRICEIATAVRKLEQLNEVATADIFQMIRNRQNEETRYTTLRIEREFRKGQIYAYNKEVEWLNALLKKYDTN